MSNKKNTNRPNQASTSRSKTNQNKSQSKISEKQTSTNTNQSGIKAEDKLVSKDKSTGNDAPKSPAKTDHVKSDAINKTQSETTSLPRSNESKPNQTDQIKSDNKAVPTKHSTDGIDKQVHTSPQKKPELNANEHSYSQQKAGRKDSASKDNLSNMSGNSGASGPSNNQPINSEPKNSGNGLAIFALIAGLGGLGLATYNYFNPQKTDFSAFEDNLSSLKSENAELNKQISTIEKQVGAKDSADFERKFSDLSNELSKIDKKVSKQPSIDTLTQQVSKDLSDTMRSDLDKKISKKVQSSLDERHKELESTITSSARSMVNEKFNNLNKKIDNLEEQVSTLVEAGVTNLNIEDLKNAQSTINKRVENAFDALTETKQDQFSSVAKEISKQIETAATKVSEEKSELDSLLDKLDTAASESRKEMALAEIKYLLNMAEQKVSIERAPNAAIDLLKQAKNRLSSINIEQSNKLINDIDEKISALDATNEIDREAIYDKTSRANELVAKLVAKSAPQPEATEKPSGSIKDRLVGVMKNTVVSVPKDPNAIKITPESAEYARQNVKLNLNFIKYAIVTKDSDLFHTNIRELKDNLSVAFTKNQAFNDLYSIQQSLSSINFDTKYPDLDSLLTSFKSLTKPN